MKKLDEILKNLNILEFNGSLNININNIALDSRKINNGDLFIALKGLNNDGHKFVEQAVNNGAAAVVYTDYCNIFDHITTVKIQYNINNVSVIAANFFDNPSTKLKIIGITGTNGKTTIATSLYNLFSLMGFKCGLISTVTNYIGTEKQKSLLTTPDAIELNSLFAKMVNHNCSYCFMEVSSHAVEQARVANIDFDGGIFTNITHDHLDYHKTFKNYLYAKKTFFDNLKNEAFTLTNIDDKNGHFIAQNVNKKFTYSLKNLSDFKAKIIERHFDSTFVDFDNEQLWIQFVGKFNVYNILSVYATASILLDKNKNEILKYISSLKPVNGRFDVVKGKGIYAIIDYAHTPDALENTLKELDEIKKHNQKIITVVGTGGNRDKSKRPIMASIADSFSDLLILTSDNPRFENPENILEDMEKGLNENSDFLKISDRKQAIKTALKIAKNNDIVFIAGKGHENYQEINGKRHHFDDKEEAEKILLV